MKKKTKSAKESHHEHQRRWAIFSKDYDDTRKNIQTLRHPKFILKKSKLFIESLTYRKINDWEEKGLISGSRDNKEAGWRKFSINDIVKLYVITDLRNLGLGIDKIKNIIEHISKEVFDAYDIRNGKGKELIVTTIKKEFLKLEYFIFACLRGEKMLLLVDESGKVFFLTEADAIDFHFKFDAASSPLIILPFFSYIEKLSTVLRKDIKMKPDTTIKELFKYNLTEQEKKILDIIRNKKYEELTIKKSNNEELTIKAKSRKNRILSDEDIISLINEKEYQRIAIVTEKGKRVALIQEESIKV